MASKWNASAFAQAIRRGMPVRIVCKQHEVAPEQIQRRELFALALDDEMRRAGAGKAGEFRDRFERPVGSSGLQDP